MNRSSFATIQRLVRHAFSAYISIALTLGTLTFPIESKADSTSDTQVIASLKAFVEAGKSTKFSGVTGAGNCAVAFSFYSYPGAPDTGDSVTISGLYSPNEDVTMAHGDGQHYDTNFEYSLTPAKDGLGAIFHVSFRQLRTERDRRDFIIDIAKNVDGRISSVTEKVAFSANPWGETPSNDFIVFSCEHLMATN